MWLLRSRTMTTRMTRRNAQTWRYCMNILYTHPKVAVVMCKSLFSSEKWLVRWHDRCPTLQIPASHIAQVSVGQRHVWGAPSFPHSSLLHPFRPRDQILLYRGACSRVHAWHRCYLSLHRGGGRLYHAATATADSRMLCMLHSCKKGGRQAKKNHGTSIMRPWSPNTKEKREVGYHSCG